MFNFNCTGARVLSSSKKNIEFQPLVYNKEKKNPWIGSSNASCLKKSQARVFVIKEKTLTLEGSYLALGNNNKTAHYSIIHPSKLSPIC